VQLRNVIDARERFLQRARLPVVVPEKAETDPEGVGEQSADSNDGSREKALRVLLRVVTRMLAEDPPPPA
jgi:hypothetical protein